MAERMLLATALAPMPAPGAHACTRRRTPSALLSVTVAQEPKSSEGKGKLLLMLVLRSVWFHS